MPESTLRSALLPPGMTIGTDGRYRILETVAVGGMACVYRAADDALGSDCAVKALPLPESEDIAERLARFDREARLLARLNHPGVVGVRDYFQECGYAFLVMDYVAGSNLFDLHRDPLDAARDPQESAIAPVPEELVVSYGLMLSDTLSRLHRSDPPVVYRDLKPHNIIKSSSDGRLILLDFGIARCFFPGDDEKDNEPLGTLGYAAPEQYERDAPLDGRTDIYSLGVVLHELATGHNPRRASSFEPLPRPRDLRPSLSPTLARVLEKCCQIDPMRRYQSARDVWDALDAWEPAPDAAALKQPVASSPAWSLTLGAPVTGAPVGSGTAVYYADNGGMICGIDSGVGRPLWIYREPGDRTMSSLVHSSLLILGQERLYAYSFPMPHGRQGVAVLDALSGAAVWRSHQSLGSTSIPVLTASGQLVIATTGPDQIMGIPVSGALPEWRRDLPTSPLTLTLVPAGAKRPEIVVMTDRDGGVSALRSDNGRILWSTRIGHGALVAPPVIADGRVFAGGGRGEAYYAGLSLDTGEIVWRVSLAAETIGPAAASADGLLVIPTRNAGLVGLDRTNGAKLWHDVSFTLPLTGAARMRGGKSVALTEYGPDGRVVVVDVTAHPTITWEASLEPDGAIAPALVTGEFLVVAAADGTVTAWALI